MFKKGDKLIVDIIDMDSKGRGIAKLDGFVIYINKTAVKDKCKIRIVHIAKNYAIAELLKLIIPSLVRRTPPCNLFGRCGGCSLLHVNYETALQVKINEVKNNFKKIAHIDMEPQKIYRANKEYAYRNKLQLPVSGLFDDIKIGFYKENSHEIVEINDTCCMCSKEDFIIINIIKKFMFDYKINAYNQENNKGIVKHIIIRRLGNIPYITLVINADNLKYQNKLIEMIKSQIINFSLFLSIHKKNNNVIMGDVVKCIYGKDKEEIDILSVKATIDQQSFMQINNEMRDILYNRVLQIVKQIRPEIVIEGFSGVGILSSIIAKTGIKVRSVEIVKKAVEDAEEIKKINNIDNLEIYCGDANILIPSLAKNIDETFLLIDPPRKGVDKNLLNNITKEIKYVIYISCNSATLARDIAILSKNFKLERYEIFDMFPNTAHVECIALIQRVKS